MSDIDNFVLMIFLHPMGEFLYYYNTPHTQALNIFFRNLLLFLGGNLKIKIPRA